MHVRTKERSAGLNFAKDCYCDEDKNGTPTYEDHTVQQQERDEGTLWRENLLAGDSFLSWVGVTPGSCLLCPSTCPVALGTCRRPKAIFLSCLLVMIMV